MKKIFSTLLLSGFMLCLATSSYAIPETLAKLKRGFINIVTSPLEIPKQTFAYTEEGSKKTKHHSVWILSGLVKGIANTVGRAGSGLWDVATFNIEMPAKYEPLMKPDYVCQKEDPSIQPESTPTP